MKNLLTIIFFLIVAVISPLLFRAHATSNWQKSQNNPVFDIGPIGSWDRKYVANPTVIKDGSLYKMWYQGATGSSWRIGYATSPDGINNWTRHGSPLLEVGSPDGWEAAMESPIVIYNSSLNKYQMWYSSIKSDWSSGVDRYRLRYAESPDGISWTKHDGWVLSGTEGKWDRGGPNRGISIIFKDGIYHLWYAGTNDQYLGTDPYWRIGYAISLDGINWEKQNNGQPVLEPTENWELQNVSFPNVMYENGVYHMWYAAGAADAPTQIVYSQSFDGINWIKTEEHNPVFSITPNQFEA